MTDLGRPSEGFAQPTTKLGITKLCGVVEGGKLQSIDAVLEVTLEQMVREVMVQWNRTTPRPNWPAIRIDISCEQWPREDLCRKNLSE